MTKHSHPRGRSDIVRRDHLARLKAGAVGVAHLVKTDNAAAAKRRDLTNEVVDIGRQNRAAAGTKTNVTKTVRSGTKTK